MEQPDYTKLDAAITDTIKRCPQGIGFTALWVYRPINEELKRLAQGTRREPVRILDQRLQALRRNNKITFNSKLGWTEKQQ